MASTKERRRQARQCGPQRGLVVKRREGEQITMTLADGSKIVITVGASGKLRIEAAPEVKILRNELLREDSRDAA